MIDAGVFAEDDKLELLEGALVPMTPQGSEHAKPIIRLNKLLILGLGDRAEVGIQMPIVLVTWLIAKRVFRWDFSLILGLAWTWTTNVFTALPCYYVFYVTGRTMLGRWDEVSGYQRFLDLWHGFFREGQTLEQQVVTMFDVLVKDWGVAMWVGCIPWSALVAFLGYRWSLKFIHAYRHAREHRRGRRRQHGA